MTMRTVGERLTSACATIQRSRDCGADAEVVIKTDKARLKRSHEKRQDRDAHAGAGGVHQAGQVVGTENQGFGTGEAVQPLLLWDVVEQFLVAHEVPFRAWRGIGISQCTEQAKPDGADAADYKRVSVWSGEAKRHIGFAP